MLRQAIILIFIALSIFGCGGYSFNANQEKSNAKTSNVETVSVNGTTYQLVPYKTEGRIVRPIAPNDRRTPVTVAIINDSLDKDVALASANTIKSFEESCRLSATVGVPLFFAIIRNSELNSAAPAISVCNGQLKKVALPQEFKATIAQVTQSERYKANAEFYKQHPLTVQVALDIALAQVSKEFPEDDRLFFVNLYSHGSSAFAMAGLTDDQVLQKNKMHDEILQKNGQSALEQNLSRKFSVAGGFFKYLKGITRSFRVVPLEVAGISPEQAQMLDDVTPKLGPDENPKLDVDSSKLDIENSKLDVDNSKLEGDTPKMGVDESPKLGADGKLVLLGMTHSEFIQSLIKFTRSQEERAVKREIGYLFIEACSANLASNRKIVDEGMDARLPVLGFYSPQTLLNVRNVDWDTLYKSYMIALKSNRAISSAHLMQKIWHNALSGTLNFKKVEVSEKVAK